MGAILGRSSGPKMGHVMGAKLGAELRKALLGSRKKHNNAPGRLRVNPELNSPGSKLLEGLLVMLAEATGGGAEVGNGQGDTGSDRLGPGSLDAGAEEAGGAAGGNTEQGGHFFWNLLVSMRRRWTTVMGSRAGRGQRQSIGGKVGELDGDGMAREGASSQLIQVGACVAARADSVGGVEPWTVTDTGNRMIFRLCVEFRPLSCLARFFSCLGLPTPPMSLRLGGRFAPPADRVA